MECNRKKIRNKDEYNALMHRLNRIEGQIRGLKKMIDEDAYSYTIASCFFCY